MKTFKQFCEEIMGAPVNSVGDGSSTALPPAHEPGIKKKKDKRKQVMGMWSRSLRK